jgi:hypothetical protein
MLTLTADRTQAESGPRIRVCPCQSSRYGVGDGATPPPRTALPVTPLVSPTGHGGFGSVQRGDLNLRSVRPRRAQGRSPVAPTGSPSHPSAPGLMLNNAWQFFMGYRFAIVNHATQALGGGVTVPRFNMTTPYGRSLAGDAPRANASAAAPQLPGTERRSSTRAFRCGRLQGRPLRTPVSVTHGPPRQAGRVAPALAWSTAGFPSENEHSPRRLRPIRYIAITTRRDPTGRMEVIR